MKYDIIIPVAKKEVGFIPKVLVYIRKNLPEVDTIFLITNKDCFYYLERKKIGEYGASLIDENNMLPNLSFKRVYQNLLSRDVHIRAGWYFQQFLKLGFAQTKYAKKYYMSWDADTLPLNHIDFFKGEQPLFAKKNEYNEPYFVTLHKILGLNKVADFSFIAEHMMFNKDIVNEMLNKISECTVEGNDWVDKILNACDNLMYPCFSEFETYGTYVLTNYPNMYGYHKLNTFRSAGIIKGRHIDDYRLNKMALDIDIASFELFDKPIFPYSYSYYIHIWHRRWNQMKNRSFKRLLSFVIGKLMNK